MPYATRMQYRGWGILRPHFTLSNPTSTERTTPLTFGHIFRSQELGKCGLDALWRLHPILESWIQPSPRPVNEEEHKLKSTSQFPCPFLSCHKTPAWPLLLCHIWEENLQNEKPQCGRWGSHHSRRPPPAEGATRQVQRLHHLWWQEVVSTKQSLLDAFPSECIPQLMFNWKRKNVINWWTPQWKGKRQLFFF